MMGGQLIELGIRGVAGGLLVVLFSLVSEAIRPKLIAGILSAAPAVALASLAVTEVAKPAQVPEAAVGMIAGGIAMIVCCLVALATVRRWRALGGSLVAMGVWLAVALGLYATVLR